MHFTPTLLEDLIARAPLVLPLCAVSPPPSSFLAIWPEKHIVIESSVARRPDPKKDVVCPVLGRHHINPRGLEVARFLRNRGSQFQFLGNRATRIGGSIPEESRFTIPAFGGIVPPLERTAKEGEKTWRDNLRVRTGQTTTTTRRIH